MSQHECLEIDACISGVQVQNEESQFSSYKKLYLCDVPSVSTFSHIIPQHIPSAFI